MHRTLLALALLLLAAGSASAQTPTQTWTTINSNNGTWFTSGSEKLNALRAWVMQYTSSQWSCSGDTCTCSSGCQANASRIQAKECVDQAYNSVFQGRRCKMWRTQSNGVVVKAWYLWYDQATKGAFWTQNSAPLSTYSFSAVWQTVHRLSLY